MIYGTSQGGLLDLLERADSSKQWAAASPCGLDLEVCMHNNALRQRLQRLSLHKVATILEDDRTQVFCENTAVAFIQLYLDQAGDKSRGREELMKLVRWPLVTATYLTHCDVDQAVLRALSCLSALPSSPSVGGAARSAAVKKAFSDKPARPPSFLSSMSFNWEASMTELSRSFALRAADSQRVCSPPFCFGGLDWYLGFDWEPAENCSPDNGHQNSWKVAAHLFAKSTSPSSKTAAAAEGAPLKLVGAKYAVTLGQDSTRGDVVYRRSDREGCVWETYSFGTGLLNIPTPPLQQWPAASLSDSASAVYATCALVLKCIVKEVL